MWPVFLIALRKPVILLSPIVLLWNVETTAGQVDLKKGSRMNNQSTESSGGRLVLDGSGINGSVIEIHFLGNQSAAPREIAVDATFFNCASAGHFILKSQARGWQRGTLNRMEAPVEFTRARDGVVYAAISPDGKNLAWCIDHGGSNELLLENLESRTTFRPKLELGIVRLPAWSPDSRRVACYYGASNALVEDGFSLMVVSLSEASAVSGPSQATGITADRTSPPQWSPDGNKVLFVGNYETADLVRSFAYIVQTDGTSRKRMAGGIWSNDGQYLLGVSRAQSPPGPVMLTRELVARAELSNVSIPFQLPASAISGRWKPDGRMFAFITDSNEVTVIDIIAKQSKIVARFPNAGRLLWTD